jgi:hypothetical protein
MFIPQAMRKTRHGRRSVKPGLPEQTHVPLLACSAVAVRELPGWRSSPTGRVRDRWAMHLGELARFLDDHQPHGDVWIGPLWRAPTGL